MQNRHFLIFLTTTGLMGTCISQQPSSCDRSQLQQCLKYLEHERGNLLYTARDETSMDETFCSEFETVKSCIDNYTNTCFRTMNKDTAKQMESIIRKRISLTESLCNKNDDLRRDYLQYVAGPRCFNKIEDKYDACFSKYKPLKDGLLEGMPTHSPNAISDVEERMKIQRIVQDKYKTLCCLLNVSNHCLQSLSSAHCSKNATYVFNQLFEHSSLIMEEITKRMAMSCKDSDYQHDSDFCLALPQEAPETTGKT